MKDKTKKAAKKLNVIGLDEKKCQQLADNLNDLLTNYQVFYMNVRGYHWNIKGEKFFELHLKFEELLIKLNGKKIN
jgi:starvation-inducible DNA-binding protein